METEQTKIKEELTKIENLLADFVYYFKNADFSLLSEDELQTIRIGFEVDSKKVEAGYYKAIYKENNKTSEV